MLEAIFRNINHVCSYRTSQMKKNAPISPIMEYNRHIFLKYLVIQIKNLVFRSETLDLFEKLGNSNQDF